MQGRLYKVFGYKGKQVRDKASVSASLDVARFAAAFIEAPRCAEVYNLGGGKGDSCSILEAFAATAEIAGKEMRFEYVDKNREGDHICYYSDLRKIRAHYPSWNLSVNLSTILGEIVESWEERLR